MEQNEKIMIDLDELVEYQLLKETPNKRITIVVPFDSDKKYIKLEYKDYDINLWQELQRLDVDGIPKIFLIEKQEDTLVVIQEYIDAPTLQTVLEQRQSQKKPKTFTRRESADIMMQLCDILKILHTQKPKIIHRDIKPENIFYQDGKIYLFDFDISRTFKKESTKDTEMYGTIGYAAPEQFGFSQTDERTDLYSLGVLYNVLLTGYLPSEMMCKKDEKRIIKRLISMNPKQRYKSAKGLKKDLNKYYHLTRTRILKAIDILIRLLIIYECITNLLFGEIVEVEAPADPRSVWLYTIYYRLIFCVNIAYCINFLKIRTIALFKKSNSTFFRFIGILIGLGILVLLITVIFEAIELFIYEQYPTLFGLDIILRSIC